MKHVSSSTPPPPVASSNEQCAKSELHLIVLWANARYQEEKILADVKDYVKIRDVYEIHWTKGLVADNFSRFYGQKLPSKSSKEKECGTGALLCLVVEDLNPTYKILETSRGHELVNITIFGLKQKYRSWTRGGHKIHTTNSVDETNHDATLLLGLNYKDLWKSVPNIWNGEVKKCFRDTTGAKGWKSLEEFFYTLNATVDYVVQRGFEDIEKTLQSNEHGDIDIMVRDYGEAALVVGGEVHFAKTRPHYLISINGAKVFIDLWDVNNKYRDLKWDNNIFDTSYLYKNLIRVPSAENYFYMMVYHALIHKREVASDYYPLVRDLFEKLGLDKVHDIASYASPFDLYFELLESFMLKRGYQITEPKDSHIFFSKNILDLERLKDYLRRKCNLKDIKEVHVDAIAKAYNTFFTATTATGIRVFVKMGEAKGMYENEYHRARELYEIDPVHFIEPLCYRDNTDNKFIQFRLTQGKSLDVYLNNNVPPTVKKRFIEDIVSIFEALKKSDVVHRDINPKNLMVVNNRLVLIDFQCAVSKSKYRELSYLKRRPGLLVGLGRDYVLKRRVWDDNYSLLKVLEFIGRDDTYASLYDNAYERISSEIGKNKIEFLKPKELRIAKLKYIGYSLMSCIVFSKAQRTKTRQKRKYIKDILKGCKK